MYRSDLTGGQWATLEPLVESNLQAVEVHSACIQDRVGAQQDVLMVILPN